MFWKICVRMKKSGNIQLFYRQNQNSFICHTNGDISLSQQPESNTAINNNNSKTYWCVRAEADSRRRHVCDFIWSSCRFSLLLDFFLIILFLFLSVKIIKPLHETCFWLEVDLLLLKGHQDVFFLPSKMKNDKWHDCKNSSDCKAFISPFFFLHSRQPSLYFLIYISNRNKQCWRIE